MRECAECASTRNSPPKAPLHPLKEIENNWQRIHIDYAGLFQNPNFLITMDAKSKREGRSISCYGFPDVMVSDNAKIFTSEIFNSSAKKGKYSKSLGH